jgi:hypothetical protein
MACSEMCAAVFILARQDTTNLLRRRSMKARYQSRFSASFNV